MYNKITTLTEFILQEERRFKSATGSLTLLLTYIENAAKIIASHIKKTGLVDIIGQTGKLNLYQESVQKLDQFSNQLLIDMLTQSRQVSMIATEETDKPIYIRNNRGHYLVFLDPLDGSSNIDVAITTGTIFSIYRYTPHLKQPGINQVAAGYILYGTSVMFVYTAGNGVNGFTLDPAIGSFLLSHPQIKIPSTGKIYSINEGYWQFYSPSLKNYLNNLKSTSPPYRSRYAACMVADVHRILIQGGIFLYPEDTHHPDGKLRLMFEVNPLALVVSQAGGLAISRGINPLTIVPKSVYQRVPIILGSPKLVRDYLSYQN